MQDWGSTATELYADLGIRYDGERGHQIAAAAAALGSVRQDAALLLHDRGRPHEEVAAYLTRWALLSPERVHKVMTFLTDPLWRAYITTYVEGERLLRAWLSDGETGPRFGRLLDEQLTPAGLRASL